MQACVQMCVGAPSLRGASGSLCESLGASGGLCTQYYRILSNITESRLRAHLPATGGACGDRPGGSLRGILGTRYRLSEREAIAQSAAVDTTGSGGRHKCVWEPPASVSLWEPLGASGGLWEPLGASVHNTRESYRIIQNPGYGPISLSSRARVLKL
jgi:hypothetical protein